MLFMQQDNQSNNLRKSLDNITFYESEIPYNMYVGMGTREMTIPRESVSVNRLRSPGLSYKLHKSHYKQELEASNIQRKL